MFFLIFFKQIVRLTHDISEQIVLKRVSIKKVASSLNNVMRE